jgi:hypothetical protein
MVISPLAEYLVFGVVREKSIILDVNLRFPKNIGVFDPLQPVPSSMHPIRRLKEV